MIRCHNCLAIGVDTEATKAAWDGEREFDSCDRHYDMFQEDIDVDKVIEDVLSNGCEKLFSDDLKGG